MMRILSMILTLLLMESSLLAEEQWIQVVYAKDAKTVAPDLLTRIKESAFPYRTIKKDGSLKVWVGSFEDLHKAQMALPLVRCRITPDAFIVQNEKKEPAGIGVYTPMVAPEKKVQKPIKLVKTKKHKPVVKKDPVKMVEKKEVCPCSHGKQAMRIAQIERAIEFYAHSPYHQFLMPSKEGED